LFGAQGLTVILFLLAVYGFFKTKDRVLRGVFLLSLGLTVFHIPFTQLKIYDFLAIPVVMLAAIGITRVPLKRFRNPFIVIVVGILVVMQAQHFQITQKWWLNPEIAPTDELTDAAQWLGEHDDELVTVYAHQASAWVGILSNKLPLNPDITHLEAFSDEYKEQLRYREEIKRALEDGVPVRGLLAQRDVRYVIAPMELEAQLDLLYNNQEWGVYR
jgi:hypothetical protein